MSKKRKIIILSCMIALLAVTAVFNFILTTGTFEDDSTVVNSANYFSQYRSERINTRNEELLQLDAIIASAEIDSPERSDALSMKIELTEITERELLLESLIKAYGFEDAVVVIGLDSDNVNVIAKSPELSTDDAIMIYSIVSEEINVSPENVKIIPIS
ncbi:MAG: SpoIIIAH-like family protein [Clostridia bacterium]|jgi:stage III sporulation protein AH|nr:SpoIIIAH-like family protein [Clostridia bacterium]